jgi:hypothetical protein
MADEWSPEKCACRWGEQPCWMCLPVLSARFAERQKPEPKRKWGDAPARIVFGGDDDHLMWTWECRLPHPDLGVYHAWHFGDVWTFGEAVKCLEDHFRGCPEFLERLEDAR